MKLLDEKGLETVWATCKVKFALAGHTHNYAGSGSPGGSANSAIGVVDYGQTGKTIQIGYSGAGITGGQIKYIAGYTDGGGNVNAKIKNVSKDALRAWLGLGSLAYSSSSIPTNLSQLTNDKGFVTGSVSGNTITINGASTTWSNTWRGIQDNLISSSTSDSLSANQGRILKGLVDSKANSSDLSTCITGRIPFEQTFYNDKIEISYATVGNSAGSFSIPIVNGSANKVGLMSGADKTKLDGIASGANNYTLPTASTTTLGGIKTGFAAKIGVDWGVQVDEQGNAYASIGGLHSDLKGKIGYIDIEGNDLYVPTTRYKNNGISSGLPGKQQANFTFPSKSGTFALTSDLPQVSKGSSYGMTEKGMIDVVYRNIQQIILLDKSGAYNISNWYKNSPEGSILDMYPYGLQGGSLYSDINNLFKKMSLAHNSPYLEEVNVLSISYNCHTRLIHINNAVLIAEYVINDY